jgi:ankyrin repeat protein
VEKTMSAQEVEDGDELLFACQDGEFDRARGLVSSGTSVDFQDEELRMTPAIGCCCDDHATILQYLIDQGAILNRADNDGATPVYISAQKNSPECLALLLQHGADANRANIDGGTPVFISA